MGAKLGYHAGMRHWTGLLVLALGLLFAPSLANAQVNGVPPSVTSFGFGGHPGWQGNPPCVTCFGFGGQPGWKGIPPSVTSLGPQGFTPGKPHFGTAPSSGHHHHHGDSKPGYPIYVYPYPYYYGYGMTPYDSAYGPDAEQPSDTEENPEDYQGGPTIFDRRGSGVRYPNEYSGAESGPEAKYNQPPPAAKPQTDETAAAAPAPPPPPPEAPQRPTVLVFKDGHKQEVVNYAIVGSNLFDLSSGRRQKIAISDLDVDATQKANEDRGVDFRLPSLPAS